MTEKSRITSSGVLAVTQEFKAGTHLGLDFTDYVGGAHVCGWLVAHSDGIVVGVENEINWTDISSSSYGNYVLIEHDGGYRTMYAHCAYHTVQVTKGQKVKKGQRIAYIGNTGQSAGAHCHFEVRKPNGEKINPKPYINADLPKEFVITYAAKTEAGWFVSVDTTSSAEYAGLKGHKIEQLSLESNMRAAYVKVHQLKPTKWLKAVKGTNAQKAVAGNEGGAIDAVMVYISETTRNKYNINYVAVRVSTTENGWLGWVKDTERNTKDAENGYAGIIGKPIDMVQIKIVYN